MNPSAPPTSRTDRRAIARQARDAFPPLGVYAIRDRETGRAVIGASRDVHASLHRAQFELRLRSHRDRTLQAAWDLGGAERLAFEVLELVKENQAPDFDYAGELAALEAFHREAEAHAAGARHA
jgi:hypothetical protein